MADGSVSSLQRFAVSIRKDLAPSRPLMSDREVQFEILRCVSEVMPAIPFRSVSSVQSSMSNFSTIFKPRNVLVLVNGSLLSRR